MACRKENGNQILLKMRFRYPKILRMENGKIGKSLQNRVGNYYFEIKEKEFEGGWHVAQKVAMQKVALQ